MSKLEDFKTAELQEKINSLNKNNITIPLEEYKDLLIIKGKYEELKNSKINSCNGNCKKNNINNGKHSLTDNNKPDWGIYV